MYFVCRPARTFCRISKLEEPLILLKKKKWPLSKLSKSKGGMVPGPLSNEGPVCSCVIKLLEKRNGYDDKTKAWS